MIEKPGRETKEAIAEIMPAIIRAFPWPKSMRWGAALGEARRACAGCGRCARSSARSATQHETAEIVPFALDGIAAGDVTYGHRFMAPAPIHVRRFDDYVDALQKAKVVLDADRRKAIILADAKNLAFAQGLTLVEDEGLLEEVAGLVEWPVVLMGEFEAEFLDLPAEVIRATIRANQKCFVLRDAVSVCRSTGHPRRRRRERTAARMAHKAGHDASAASSPTSSSSSRTSSRATAARRSRPATGASCARASPTRAISGRPISRPCRTTRTSARSRSTSGWRN